MIQVESKDLARFLEEKKSGFFYFYTPLCGSCQLARQMIELAEKSSDLPIYALDLNLSKEFAPLFKIEAVPVLVRIDSGEFSEKTYTLDNIVAVFRFLKKFT
ncbi:thioredoxin [Listeria fleischmannii subsp. fleischmannii]|uniref:Thioredoxin n=1 Tax=Listeria fleischmannii subsp. fleischmannii TaxID=1671902 RepID=A0A2X3HHR2_9LIST|nr:thioredoxin family protein [Listeria fleischmannii]SQC72187.1 thioredoxin [Listeria fleischmannii subsp. fleischmannii]